MYNVSDTPFSLGESGASAGSALFVAAVADAGAAGVGSVSSKSSRFKTGAGADSGALLVALDCVVDERVWLVALGAFARRGDVSKSPASYSSKSDLLAGVSRNPLPLPPPLE
jgi:hypothetical protein